MQSRGPLNEIRFNCWRHERKNVVGFCAGLLKASKGGKPPFQQLSRTLKLMVEDLNPTDPGDVAYVYSGYAPISIRLVEAALRSAF